MFSGLPLVPTLRIKPAGTISELACCSRGSGGAPGKSTKEISVYSGPVISKQTMFGEKESSLGAFKSRSSCKNLAKGTLGFKIASCARNTRPSSKSLSVIISPKGSFLLCPSDTDTRRKETRHDHSRPSPRIRRHSMGHLQGNTVSPSKRGQWGTTSCMHLPVPSGVSPPIWLG